MSETEADFAERGGLDRRILKHCVPGRLLARKNAAAPIMETRGTESERIGVSAETEGFCEGSLAALADDVGIGNDGSSNCGRKMILFNTQSINGL